jgi:hypothetical protein
MSVHRYPHRSLVGDYVRAAAGLALTAGPLAVVPAGAVAGPVLGGLAVLFALFGARTALRQASRIEIDDDALALVGPWTRRIAWREVTGLRLRYFATRRDRSGGWMQLVVTSSNATLRLDSTLDGFPAIARHAARVACERGIALTPATVDNLRVFGVTLETSGRGPEG